MRFRISVLLSEIVMFSGIVSFFGSVTFGFSGIAYFFKDLKYFVLSALIHFLYSSRALLKHFSQVIVLSL